MYTRIAIAFLGLFAALPAQAEEMKADEARQFVVGKNFAFNCFEGTRGAGRIQADGSVVGSVQFQGSGPMRNVRLPANTLRVSGEQVCASVKGMPFTPCFNLDKTSPASFTGAISGLGFAYCSFDRRGRRLDVAKVGTVRTLRHSRRVAPVQSAAALPAVE
jgi:hypothetical protein